MRTSVYDSNTSSGVWLDGSSPGGMGVEVKALNVVRYNTVRLHSAIGYVTPHDRLAGRQAEIHAARDHKLEQARSQRQLRRQHTTSSSLAWFCDTAAMTSPGETEAGSAGTQPC